MGMTLIRRLDSTFHETRNYMTPAIYQNEEILAYIGACKESGCTFTARHISREGRDRLVWRHRRDAILVYRLNFFEKALTDDEAIAQAMTEQADKHTHTYNEWMGLTNALYHEMLDLDEAIEMPPFQYEVYYQTGFNAHDAAKRVADRTLT